MTRPHTGSHRKEGDQYNAAYRYGQAGKPVCREPLRRGTCFQAGIPLPMRFCVPPRSVISSVCGYLNTDKEQLGSVSAYIPDTAPSSEAIRVPQSLTGQTARTQSKGVECLNSVDRKVSDLRDADMDQSLKSHLIWSDLSIPLSLWG